MRRFTKLGAAALSALAAAAALAGDPPLRRENRLARERSPYLLQHAHNPVDWYPWGDEAFAKARAESKPVFLSVGYSACHWCHVMERESFEDEAVGRLLNERFVSVKVDREERPDVDEVYMRVTQMLTGSGGWPMTLFLTPEKKPFFAGTYFPKDARSGMPSFRSLLEKIDSAWRERRKDVLESAAEIERAAAEAGAAGPDAPAGATLGADPAARAIVAGLERRYDERNGGFGSAPKFPPHHALRFLLDERVRVGERAVRMALATLDRMAEGGIHDHVGGGFARYSTDEEWHVPHFEKMLYDNALLARAYVDAFAATGLPRYRDVAEGIFAWVLREMTDEKGGFFSALDADSEGVEGKYYVFTPSETAAVLGDRAAPFDRAYDLVPGGSWERGVSIPRLTRSHADPRAFAAERAKLLEARRKRVPPGLDDKVLTSWNGLMIGALARGGAVLDEVPLREAAERAARFVLGKMRGADGRLLRSYRRGDAGLKAYLDDHAFLADGLLDLHDATHGEEWLLAARSLADRMLADYEDRERGGFSFTAHDAEALLFRTKDPFDGALPAGNAVAARALVRLSRLTGDPRYLEAADRTFRAFAGAIERAPTAAITLVGALALRGDLAAPPPATPAITATASLAGGPLRPGGEATLRVRLVVAPPFHIAAPLLSVTVTSDLDVDAGAVELPKPERAPIDLGGTPLEVYPSALELDVKLRARVGGTPFKGTVGVRIRAQVCNGRMCLAPQELTVETPAEIRTPN